MELLTFTSGGHWGSEQHCSLGVWGQLAHGGTTRKGPRKTHLPSLW